MATEELGRYPALDFSPDRRRRMGAGLLIAGLAILLVLLIAVYVAISSWSYAAAGTETFDYWFDIVVVAAFSLGVGAALVGLTLIAAGKTRPPK